MKPKTVLPAILLSCIAFTQTATAQTSVEEAMSRKHPDCKDAFLNACDVIPKLYKEHAVDSIQKVIDIWESACGEAPEIKYAKILLSIELSSFNSSQPDIKLIESLESYSSSYKNLQRYRAYSGPASNYYKVSAVWAKLLLERKNLSVNEKFICNVFAGNIKEPMKEIRQHKEEYAELYDLLNKNLAAQKKGGVTEYTFITGIWDHTGNATILGVHPSLGFQGGARFDRNQIDLTIQFRFINTVDSYTVKRNNSLYDLNNYFGGYIGLDYNYYFINKTKFDLGLLGGIGYDGFDITSGDNYDNDYMKPTSISSLNVNTGLRFNYVISHSFYLGLQGRYSFVNYGTGGGSNLNGDAFSIELILGVTTRQTNTYRQYY